METARVGVGRCAVSSLALTNITLTRTAHVDSMSLSATNAAGGTRVIGVGCRYYTTLRRGVFICELLQP